MVKQMVMFKGYNSSDYLILIANWC